MPLSFPSNPSVNQTSTQNGRVYRWSGSAWEFATVGASGNLTGTVTIPASGDPFWSNTLLLLRGNGNIVDESSYSRSVTAAGNVSATSPPKFGTNSIVFDGSNDWVTFAQNDFDFIPQLLASWTFEAWLYPTSYANYSMIMQHGANGPQCATAQILLNQGTGTVTAGVSSAGSDQKFMYVYTNDGLPLNAWTHLAAVYDATGEVLRLFLNGQLAGSEAKPSGGTWSYRNEGIRIGNYVDVNAASYGFVGRMDDVRISNAARYTASFTPPAATLPTGAYVAPITLPVSFTGGTSPVLADPSALKWITAPASATATGTAGDIARDSSYVYVCTATDTWKRAPIKTWDASFGSVSLLLHLNAEGSATATSDSSSIQKSLTLENSAVLSGTESKYGGSSLYSGAANNAHLLTQHHSDLSLGTGDFTVECWVNAASTPSDKGIFDCRSGQVSTEAQRRDGFTLTAYSSSVIRIYSDGVLISSSGTSYTNTWVHVAVVRQSGVMTLYVDGVSQGTSSAVRDMTNDDWVIGGGRYGGTSTVWIDQNTTSNFPGYIDEFRVTKGVARYTANFTPSTAAFPDS